MAKSKPILSLDDFDKRVKMYRSIRCQTCQLMDENPEVHAMITEAWTLRQWRAHRILQYLEMACGITHLTRAMIQGHFYGKHYKKQSTSKA